MRTALGKAANRAGLGSACVQRSMHPPIYQMCTERRPCTRAWAKTDVVPALMELLEEVITPTKVTF